MNGRRRVTMAQVGDAAGVTARTVSNVLSDSAAVRPETRERVLRAVQELGYQMNTSARGLRTGRTGFITLAIPDLGIDYFAELARLVMAEAARHGWTVVIQQTGADRRAELEVLSGSSRQLSDGLLFQPHALGPGDEKHLVGGNPLVLLGDRIFHGPVDHVTMANVEAARIATTYLVDRRRVAIGAIGANPAGGSVSAAALRLSGFREAIEQNGQLVDERRVALAAQWHRGDGALAMARLLDSGVDLDAVFCFNDTLALGALHTLAARGVKVPDDVAVVGFDNVPASAYAVPALTTIDPGVRQIATSAVDLLARQLDGDRQHTPVEVVAAHSLVVRRSA